MKDTRTVQEVLTRDSPPEGSVVLVDSQGGNLPVWESLEEAYSGCFTIAIGESAPLGAVMPDDLLGTEDVALLLTVARVVLADSDRYKTLTEEAGVRFFRVDQ